jgi:hypothetical protein
MRRFLIAMRNLEILGINAEIQQAGHSCHVINSIVDRLEFPDDTIMALVDEDFDGLQTGWHLASEIRQTNYPIKIIMMVRKHPDIKLLPLYDVLWGLPFSIEALKAEIERKWKPKI